MNRRLNIFRLWVVVACISVLSGCGGGGGGSSGGSTSNPLPPVVADSPNRYLPTDANIRWVYNGDTTVYFSQDTVAGGMHVHSLLYPTAGKEYFVTTADQIGMQGLYLPSIVVGDGVVYTGDIKFNNLLAILRSDWSAGASQAVNGAGTINIVPTYGSNALNFSGTITYEGEQPINTGLGSFVAKCVAIDLMLNTTVQGNSFSIPYAVNFCFAQDVGIVRRNQGSISYLLSSAPGLDSDGDGFVGIYDEFPKDGNRWEVGPLYASDDGVAFTSLPSHSLLAQTVTIMTGNGPAPMPWAATADQSWLTLTQNPGSQLSISANPVGLAPNALYYATISISSTSAEVQSAPAHIRVGLWVGDHDAPATNVLSVTPTEMVNDPLRPYVYLNNGTSVLVYNIYDQSLVNSIAVNLPASAPLRVSSDGSFLYTGVGNLIRVALDPPYTQVTWQSTAPAHSVALIAYMRPQGHPVIVEGLNGDLYDAMSGAYFSQAQKASPVGLGVYVEASLLGNRYCGSRDMFVPVPLNCYELFYKGGDTPNLRVHALGGKMLTHEGYDIALSDSGDRVFVAENTVAGITAYNPLDMKAMAVLPTSASAARVVEVGPGDTVYGGSTSISSFNKDFSVRSNLSMSAQARQLRVSGDGAVVMGLDSGNLTFMRNY